MFSVRALECGLPTENVDCLHSLYSNRLRELLPQLIYTPAKMGTSKPDEEVEVNFESHPPIDEDIEGIVTLLKQTLLHYIDCTSIARHLIEQKDITQVIALEAPSEDGANDDDEPDNDIYGVSSVLDITPCKSGDDQSKDGLKQILKFLRDKCPDLKGLTESKDPLKLGFIVNERYINLPAQLALPFLSNLTKHIEDFHYTHLVFVAKILIKSRSTDTKLPSKKSKSGKSSSDAEPLIYVNAEEEILFEHCEFHSDVEVSAHCDENATWFAGSDVKYIPHRRIIVLKQDKWKTILADLEKELK